VPEILIAVGAALLLLMVMMARQPRGTRPAPKRATGTDDPGSSWMDGGSSSSRTSDDHGPNGSADSDCGSDGDGSAGDDGGGSGEGGGDGGGGDGGGD